MKKKRYVLGFAFNGSGNCVLIEKAKPETKAHHKHGR